MKNNKRGILLPAVLKLILAAIGIGVLFYLLSAVYLSVQTSRDLGLAKETLTFLMDETKAGRASADIYNPIGWMIATWPHNIKHGGEIIDGGIPKSCSNTGLKSCICICKYDLQSRVILDLTAADCDDVGICLNNEGFLIEGDATLKDSSGATIEIKDPLVTLSIDQTNKIISRATEEVGGGFGGGGGNGF